MRVTTGRRGVADEEAFTAMFRLHYPRVLAFVSRRTDQARAHDVVAETFATAWRHFGRLPEEPLPWLYRVARNSLANEERSARRQTRLAERIGRRGVEAAPDHAASVVTDAGLREALGRLSRTDREALLLIAWEGLDHVDAARVMGCSAVAFKVRLHRARKRLARLLEAADRDGPVAAAQPPLEMHRATPTRGRSA
jgi:RNA polymerase sigma factor (sigma-70 family)